MALLLSLLLAVSILGGCSGDAGIKDETKQLREMNSNGIKATLGGDYDKALSIYGDMTARDREALNDSSKDIVAKAYCSLGYIYLFHKEQYMQSFEALSRAREIAESLPQSKELGYIYLNLAALYEVYSDHRSSSFYLAKSFDEALYHKQYDIMLTAAFNLLGEGFAESLSKENMGRLQRMERLPIPESPMRQVVIDMLKAYNLKEEGKAHEALGLIEKIKESPIDAPYVTRLGELCDMLGLAVSISYRLPAESQLFAGRIEESLDSIDKDLKGLALSRLASSYSERGDDRKAAELYRQSIALDDSIFSVSQYSLLHDWEVRNKETRHAEKMKSAEDKQRELWFIIIGAAVLLLVSGTAGVLIAIQNKRLLARNRELYKQHLDRDRMEEELIDMRKEREGLFSTREPEPDTATDEATSPEEPSDEADDPADEAEEMEEADENPESNRERELAMLRSLTPKVSRILDSEEVTSPDFSLEKLAALTGSNRAYVSKVINTFYRKNFKAVLNDIRIRMACQRLREPGKYRNMTVEALAESVGYKSRSTFVVTFKKITGPSPSDYRKAAE